MKNKSALLILLPALAAVLALSSCDFYVVDETKYSENRLNSVSLETSYNNEADTIENSPIEKRSLAYTYQDLFDHYVYKADNMPLNGQAKMLIIPIWFNDSSSFGISVYKEVIRQDIYDSFFGTDEITKWRSVSNYYKQESFNKLEISGTVAEWYECNHSFREYCAVNDQNNESQNKTKSLVQEAVEWFKSENSDISSFDADNDGYIDSVALIYAAPDYATYNKTFAGMRDPMGTNMWAYSFWRQEELSWRGPRPIANSYLWASYDFMYDNSRPKCGAYGHGDCLRNGLDTHTFIHETGHLLGLQDYYDYAGSLGYEAAGYFSMQDNNVGGHDPYSKIALGWDKPYVVDKNTFDQSITLTIRPNQETGDVILLTPKFNNSPFDEYLLLELYTPTGLNEYDVLHDYLGNIKYRGATGVGVRLWHVDARLISPTAQGGKYIYTDVSTITTNPYNNNRNHEHATTNTSKARTTEGYYSEVPGFENYRLLQLIRKDTKHYACDDHLKNSSLFVSGDTFNMSSYGNCFYNTGKLNSNADLGFSISFDAVDRNSATITIAKV